MNFLLKKIKNFFNKNGIERTNDKFELKISDIDKIYKISSIFFSSSTRKKNE